MAKTLEQQDAEIKAMEEKFGGKWQELCIDLVNVPAAQAIDDLWREVILGKMPGYGDWEYPGQAYRHLVAEYRELLAFREAAQENLTTVAFGVIVAAAKEKNTATTQD